MVTLETRDGKIYVKSPYNPEMPSPAKRIGGRWSAPYWVFDARDEARVRELCIKIYGTDGSPATGDLVTVRCRIFDGDWNKKTGGLFLAGRQVACAAGRDSGAKLGGGVVIIEGRGFTSSGSMKNWYTTGRDGTIFEIRDVPRAAAEREIDAWEGLEVSIVEPAATDARAALTAQRAALKQQLDEIEAKIAALETAA